MVKFEDLMGVHEGICPECGGDLDVIEISGVSKFILDQLGIVSRVSLVDSDDVEISGRDCPEPEEVKEIEHNGEILRLDVSFYERLETVNVWDDSSDGYGDLGVFIYQCSNCERTFESYLGCGGDWTLA